MTKINKWLFNFLLATSWIYLSTTAMAQVMPMVVLNSQVQDVVEFKAKRFLGEISLRLPLPAGNWTVRYLEKSKSTHQTPAEGILLFLDKIANNKVQESLLFYVYPQENKNWSTGEGVCFGAFLSRERGGSVNGYCHSLKNITFMTNAKSDWQGKVRTL